MSLAITVTLLFRSLGAFIFGLLGDRYGRRWVLSTNLLIVAALELGTAYSDTYAKFIAVRSLFGIGMGGIWGLSSQTALENAPVGARGMLSGIMQEGAFASSLSGRPTHATLPGYALGCVDFSKASVAMLSRTAGTSSPPGSTCRPSPSMARPSSSRSAQASACSWPSAAPSSVYAPFLVPSR